ncbi:MAG: hypothetical protein JRJ27_16180 [Deltaproteobacteria bacterium]|nr:hypothetical protein [Deltaproteobacteria bacterium]
MLEFIYFTLKTLGFGDIIPVTSQAISFTIVKATTDLCIWPILSAG